MVRAVTASIVAILIGATAIYVLPHQRGSHRQGDLAASLHAVEQELSEIRKERFGNTKFTEYLDVTRTAMSEQAKFLAATVDREYVHVEHIRKTVLGIPSEATIVVRYAVEYSLGYDLTPGSFDVSGDAAGITVTLRRPELVAFPAVKILSHDIPSSGFLIDEREAVIALQQKLHDVARKRGEEIGKDEAVIALCEKKLAEFLRDFLSKQPGVRAVPPVRFAYK